MKLEFFMFSFRYFLCGFSHTLSATAVWLALVCIRGPSVCHGEDPGNENECLCVAAIKFLGCCHHRQPKFASLESV